MLPNIITKKNIFVLSAVTLILGLNIFLVPYIHRREATNIVTTILNLWVKDDLSSAFNYWENPQKTPPVYDLASFKINRRVFSKEDGIRRARFFATLHFPAGHTFPSDEEWVFELRKTRLGWKVVDFRLAD